VRAYKILGMGSNEWQRFVQEMRRKAAFSHFSSAPANRFFTRPSNLAPRRSLDCVPGRQDAVRTFSSRRAGLGDPGSTASHPRTGKRAGLTTQLSCRGRFKSQKPIYGPVCCSDWFGRYAGTASMIEVPARVSITRLNRNPLPGSNASYSFRVRCFPPIINIQMSSVFAHCGPGSSGMMTSIISSLASGRAAERTFRRIV
jgi:hypothetical protein